MAQIYRTWEDKAGQKWVNACWYYRPEQTVHRAEKHFYESEVVKTGQYRDHRIQEVIDRCFVMFITRFPKGRPRGLPKEKSVYVCESRYNEDRHRFAKIKTWVSCVPDEVREKDYQMELFDQPRRLKKMPSPIKHLLRDDAKPTDSMPKPTWGASNAPPLIGAVHCRERESNVSAASNVLPICHPLDSCVAAFVSQYCPYRLLQPTARSFPFVSYNSAEAQPLAHNTWTNISPKCRSHRRQSQHRHRRLKAAWTR